MAKARIANPRWLWITAAVLGAICTIAFVVMMVAPREEAAPGPRPLASSGLGFGAGVLVGLAAGIGIGVAIARQLRDHSSRNKP